MELRVYKNSKDLGRQAASWCAGYINKTVREQGHARIIVATGASQFDFLDALLYMSVPWDKVTCFHLDEYVGITEDHPASFRGYLEKRFWRRIMPPMNKIHKLNPEEIEVYSSLLLEADIDLACIGIGENGHIAFNDPPVANFNDVAIVRTVELDDACRRQQVGEGWFPSVEETPTHAATLTVPAIMRAKALSVVVPDDRKAVAVRKTLFDPISTDCPATILRRHDKCMLWLDQHSYSTCEEIRKVEWSKTKDISPALKVPGLVDLQVNGYKGIDFSSEDLTEESFVFACREIIKSGVVVFLPTVITSPMSAYRRVLPMIAKVIKTKDFKSHIPGIHLEGPFISSMEGARSCHNENCIIKPDITVFEELQNLADGKIIMLTIAAELEGARELASYANVQGVRVSLGHQLADSDHISSLVQEGAVMLTHLGNAVPSKVHKHKNPIIAGLAETRLTAAIITDGHHLPIELIKVILKAKGIGNVVVTSDMSPFAGQKPGEYVFAGQEVVLSHDGRGCLKGSDVLAGSASTLLQCANFLLKHSINVSDVEKLCYYNPLKILGIDHRVITLQTKRLLCLNEENLMSLL